MLLLISVLAFPASVPSGRAESSPITVAPGLAIEDRLVLASGESDWVRITPPIGITDMVLDPKSSPIVKQETMLVESDGKWKVSVYADEASGGHMTECDASSSQYVPGGSRLLSALLIKTEKGNEVDLSQGGVLIEGSGTQIINVTSEQSVSWLDGPLPEGHNYKIMLTFVASIV